MVYGSFNRLLRVDLNEKKFVMEEIGQNILNTVIGGKGLGTFLLLERVDPKVDPLSPENKVIFTTGPSCDTSIGASSRYGVFTKSPLTGIYAESYSGGHVAPIMKRTGFDAIILEGASSSPVYIHIHEEGAIFHDGSDLWGLESFEAEDRIKEKIGINGVQILVIGPAGENMVKFACIKNNYWRSAGRTGIGAVLGSKKIKGIAFSGTAKAEMADPDSLKKYALLLREKGKDDAGVKNYYNLGTPMLVKVLNEANAFPTQYWRRGRREDWHKISAEYMKENMDTRPRACRGCFMACGKMSRVIKGRHAGLTLEGPEYETIYAFGGLCCVEHLEDIAYLNDICDRLGMDTISAGNIVGFAIEAGLKGKFDNAPAYGDVDAIAKLLKDIGTCSGTGAILAKGIKSASRQLGLEDLAVHVKGLEPAGYDPRALKGMGLAYATSDRGACHLRSTFYKLELSGVIPPEQIEGKAELFIDYEDRLTIFDCLIFCRFYRDLIGWEDLETVITAITGQHLNKKQLRQIANQITAWTRKFNLEAGVRKKDDTLPARFFREALDDKSKKTITEKEINYLVNDYYRLRGWNEEGVPAGQ